MLKYKAVAQDIVQKITEGEYLPNDRLPTTPELCEQYQVSKITIKKAMDELELGGLIARRRGSGTYVKGLGTQQLENAPQGWSMSSQMGGYTKDHPGHEVGSHVYDFSVVRPPVMVADELGIQPDEFCYHVCRTRTLDGTPNVIEYTYMPIKVVPDLREHNVQTTIYGYIQNDLGLKIASAHRTLEAVLVTDEEAQRLQVEPNSPALQVTQVGFLDDGTAFEHSISRHVRGYKFFSISTV
ncbi:MAG: GntR family transcriptional regulator [Atopobiaceae bacterium]